VVRASTGVLSASEEFLFLRRVIFFTFKRIQSPVPEVRYLGDSLSIFWLKLLP